ncbi:BQ5605_C008g05363 [Microbotryum silenes-dioicae]|uniref:BQ5605_C008g05363 protein n=1 Tax=Microbotryum silenes-dioicae TaxID=796604 RepID=A0A2X0MD68_9BASI|nr:BQ5605_C008g05363 [Microbotryum silenes-dioicae]
MFVPIQRFGIKPRWVGPIRDSSKGARRWLWACEMMRSSALMSDMGRFAVRTFCSKWRLRQDSNLRRQRGSDFESQKQKQNPHSPPFTAQPTHHDLILPILGSTPVYFLDCVDSGNVWIAARSVLCDALGLDTIDNTHYTAVQRMFGLPKLKASLRDQEGAGRTIEIFTGLVLEMISSGRWGMQKWGTRMEGVVRRRIILEERLKLRAGGAWGRRGQ